MSKAHKPTPTTAREVESAFTEHCCIGFTWNDHVPRPFVSQEGPDQHLAQAVRRFFVEEWSSLAAQDPKRCRAFEDEVSELRWDYTTYCDVATSSGPDDLNAELQKLVLDRQTRWQRLKLRPFVVTVQFKRDRLELENAGALLQQRDDSLASQIGPAWDRLRTEKPDLARGMASFAQGTKWLVIGRIIGGEYDEHYAVGLTLVLRAIATGAKTRQAASRIELAREGKELAIDATLLACPPDYEKLAGSAEETISTALGRWALRQHGASERPSVEKAVESLELAEVRGDVLPEHLALRLASLPNLREAIVTGQEQRFLQDIGLGLDAIGELVATGEEGHAEVRRRFATARETLGLNALQAAFNSYQDAVVQEVGRAEVHAPRHDADDVREVQGDEPRGGRRGSTKKNPSRESKRDIVSKLNSVAEALCAMFEVQGQRGRLDVTGARPGTFQLRPEVREAGKPMGLGQTIPELRLRSRRGGAW